MSSERSASSSDQGNYLPDHESLFQEVSNALLSDASNKPFAIGGRIELGSATPSERDGIMIRWDSGEGQGRNVSLPMGNDPISQAAFQKLMEDCQPATFGRGGEDVLDETYRKAGKMNTTQFCTDFSLAEHGVIDTIVQALLQEGAHGGKYNGVRAELYKLNVYSGPSGKFKPHVDTPRSDAQMGSLVVCLPSSHQGGEFVVRHASQEVRFDWSKRLDCIQWAAFFSDCEHEVLRVSEGHRVTLTYNLYWTDYGPSHMARQLNALDQSSFHFYVALEKLINCPSFLPKGGLIGFSCTHGYPHTSPSSIPHLDRRLKGVDMLVYQVFKRLTGSARVRAVLDASEYEEERRERLRDTMDCESSASGTGDELASETYLTDFLFAPRLNGMYEEEEMLDPTSITHFVSRNNGPEGREPAFFSEKVIWLTGKPQFFEELAVAFITVWQMSLSSQLPSANTIQYGNEASIDAYYSAAVITSYLGAFDMMTGRRA
ncbi:hypothetical protein LTR84_004765 [Exophiala bonariae]|uniref:Fe2OG dioxygenase domain-containing protein n=1 Tax=Exophiala bonariae TaxID=1690606 RepID=A0AAV9NMT1_9EURO|nr:hypothetical protein LTR84_004765 [Exophiala bonariae]